MAELKSAYDAFWKREEATTPKGKITAKATSQELAAANKVRVEIYICNPSAKEVWIALGPTAVKEEGIYLKKEGGAVVITGHEGIISVITTEGEGLVTFAEV